MSYLSTTVIFCQYYIDFAYVAIMVDYVAPEWNSAT